LTGFCLNFCSLYCRSQKAGKSSVKSADRHVQSSCDPARPADMDSCLIINDETILADRLTGATDQSLHMASQPSVVGGTVRGVMSETACPSAVAVNSDDTKTAAKSGSRLFDLVNAGSPVAHVS